METIWNGRTNSIEIVPTVDGIAVSAPAALDTVNKLRLRLEDKAGTVTPYDSQSNPTYFGITQRYVDGSLLRVFSLILGSAGLAAGDYSCVLTMYDSVNTAGVVIAEFRAQVRDA